MKDDIYAALNCGGLVISDRQTGKTTALLEYAASIGADDCIVVAMNEHSRGVIAEAWKRRFGSIKPPEIVGPNRVDAGRGTSKKILVDEWYYGTWKERFDAAVTSMPFPVTVVGRAKGDGDL